jgi:hypothetical protein
MSHLCVTGATYKGDYRVELQFNNAEKRVVDFGPFLQARPHPQYNAYKDKDLFQSFRIENGNLVWGDNWDLIFPVSDLYNGTI